MPISRTGGTFGPNDTRVDVGLTQIIASGLIGYRLPLGLPENVELSATVGFRYQHLKADVDISPTLFPVEISREGTEASGSTRRSASACTTTSTRSGISTSSPMSAASACPRS